MEVIARFIIFVFVLEAWKKWHVWARNTAPSSVESGVVAFTSYIYVLLDFDALCSLD